MFGDAVPKLKSWIFCIFKLLGIVRLQLWALRPETEFRPGAISYFRESKVKSEYRDKTSQVYNVFLVKLEVYNCQTSLLRSISAVGSWAFCPSVLFLFVFVSLYFWSPAANSLHPHGTTVSSARMSCSKVLLSSFYWSTRKGRRAAQHLTDQPSALTGAINQK